MAAPSKSNGVTAEERAAIKEYTAEARGRSRKLTPAESAREVAAKIAEMPEADRLLSERIHSVIMTADSSLTPRTFYGSPAYYRNGKMLCFFQVGSKFKTRYATLGFGDAAKLDDGELWPTSYAVIGMNAEVEARIGELIRRASRD